ncbi:MAG: hypothetical protein COB60_03320 [Flavobacteriaceae bacterium]|nr:MAG: hypothetical protein COB60_03320 [Flavobacteriaceae bacterium]
MRITALILFAFLISNCSSTKSSTKDTAVKVNFEQIIQETQGGFPIAKFLIIKEENTVLKIYNQINKIRKPGFEIPTIDFDKQMLIALFMGEKNTGGFSISVEHITESSEKMTVFVKESTPEGMATMAITSPFCFVLLDKSDKEIVFEKK